MLGRKGNQRGNASRSEGGVMGCSTPHCVVGGVGCVWCGVFCGM